MRVGHHSDGEMKWSGTQPLSFHGVQSRCHFGRSSLEPQCTPLLRVVIPFQLQGFALSFAELPEFFSHSFPEPVECHLPALPSSTSTAPQKRDGVNVPSRLIGMGFPGQGPSLMAVCLGRDKDRR